MSETIVGSVGVQLVPSAKGFREKANSLLSGLKVDVGINLVDKAARAQLDELTRPRTATVNADADTTSAEAQLDAAARPRTATINGGGSAGGLMKALIGGAALLGPALVPISAAFAGIATSVGIAAVAVTSLEKKQQKIAQLQHTAATTTSKKTYASAIAQAKALEASIDGPQRKFLSAQRGLGAAFNGLVAQIGTTLFGPLTAGLNLLSDIMPRLAPLVVQVSDGLGDLIGKLDAGVQGGGFTKFLNYVMSTIPPVVSFLASFGATLANLFVGLAPAGATVLAVLTGIFDLLAKVPADVIAPIAIGLLGLVVGPWFALFAGLAVIFETLYQKSTPFRDAINELGASLKSSLAPAIASLKDYFSKLWPVIKVVAGVILVMLGYVLKLGAAILGAIIPPLVRFDELLLKGVVFAIKVALTAFAKFLGGIGKVAGVVGKIPIIGKPFKAAGNAAQTASHQILGLVDSLSQVKSKSIIVHVGIFETIQRAISPVNALAGKAIAGGIKGGVVKAPKVDPFAGTPSFGGGGGGGGSKSKKASPLQTAVKAIRADASHLLSSLVAGVSISGSKLKSVLGDIAKNLAALPKDVRTPLQALVRGFSTTLTSLTNKMTAAKSQLSTLKSDFKELASSIKEAFTPKNLFDSTLGALKGGLAKALVNVKQALAAQKVLLAAGVNAAFVGSLLASGNGLLATQLAGSPDLAKDLSAQFAQVQHLAAVAANTQAEAQINPQITRTNQLIADLNHKVDQLAEHVGVEVGKAINRAVPKKR